jgi:hypothetical protein
MIHELRGAMNNIACLAQALKEYRGLRPDILRLQDGRLDRNVPIRFVMQFAFVFCSAAVAAKHGTECGGDSCAHPRAEQSRAWNEQVGLAKKSQDYISITLPTQKPGASVRVDSDFTEEL